MAWPPDGGSRKGADGCGAAAGGRGAMAWARSAAGWLGGFLLLPGEPGGQGPGLGGGGEQAPRLGKSGAPWEPRKGRERCRAPGWEPLADMGGTHAARRCLDPGWTPHPARSGVTGCLDRNLKRGAVTAADGTPGVQQKPDFVKEPRHPHPTPAPGAVLTLWCTPGVLPGHRPLPAPPPRQGQLPFPTPSFPQVHTLKSEFCPSAPQVASGDSAVCASGRSALGSPHLSLSD